jgi:hypothetical protein
MSLSTPKTKLFSVCFIPTKDVQDVKGLGGMTELETHSPLANSEAVFGWVDADQPAHVTFPFDCKTINRSQNAFSNDGI